MKMWDENKNRPKSLPEQFHQSGNSRDANRSQGYSAQQIRMYIENHPELRMPDNQAHMQLARLACADSSDPDVQEMFAAVVEMKSKQAFESGDAFFDSYPLPGTTIYPPDFIETGIMPTKEPVGFSISQMPRNMVLGGPNGSGKTTCLRAFLSDPKLLTSTRIIAFGKKRELRGLVSQYQNSGYVVVFQMDELKLSFSQPPQGVKDAIWCNELSKLFGQVYERLSAHRLMNSVLNDLLVNRPPDVYPTLEQLILSIEKLKPHVYSRTFQLKESILSCLQDLLQCTGDIWNYSSSDCLEVLFSSPGLAVIELDTLPQEHFTFLASYFMRWCYCRKLYAANGA
jgi:hypothetical protein